MIAETAPAKINLALHVRARRDDGYHEIETLFAFLRDGDRIEVSSAEQDTFGVRGPFAEALAGEGNNLVTRARDAFRSAFGGPAAVAITLDKRLPVASGIGGGSADAAATLRALAALVEVDVTDPRLSAVALGLGSDVPACLAGRAMFGCGRGERLVDAPLPDDLAVLLVNPGVPVSTASVFAGWDGMDRGPLGEGDALAAAIAGRNDLQPAAIAIAPAIGDTLETLMASDGARLVRMSGSGATCFGLYEDIEARDAAERRIAAEHPEWWQLASTLA